MPNNFRSIPMHAGSAAEVFTAFLQLGLTSFGGPIAHVGYFRREFVERRGWISESQFAQLLAISQFLPGPASSQLGFSLGLLRAGWRGAAAAFAGFTLPSALLMFAFATVSTQVGALAGGAVLHGLKLVALPIVAQGTFAMARSLCPDVPRALLAAISAVVMVAIDQSWAQLLVIVFGALIGVVVCRNVTVPASDLKPHYSVATGWILLATFLLLLFVLPVLARFSDELFGIAAAFYRAGALVFGGAHVVLPLLEEAVVKPGMVSSDEFLAGYGAAQAVPGPMFTFAAYLGARLLSPEAALLGSVIALAAIFLPGLLLMAGTLPLWHRVASHPIAGSVIAGVNATVVGLLAAALYDPIWTSAVRGWSDIFIALIGLLLLIVWRTSALVIVIWCVAATVGVALLAA